ncbi:nuclease [Elasticomyces elasticus]|nr:nuclease [Elasticomyces elasticus]
MATEGTPTSLKTQLYPRNSARSSQTTQEVAMIVDTKYQPQMRSGVKRQWIVGEGFNRDYWAHFEDFCRRLTSFYPSVRIVTGPLYLPKREADGKWRVSYEVIGHPPNVAVPTHFYKIIFAEDGKTGGNVSLGAFVLPNAVIQNDKPLKDFEVPVEAVERASGLEFAGLLPPARRRRLCDEINCSVIVKEYAERQRTMMTPPPAKSGQAGIGLAQR